MNIRFSRHARSRMKLYGIEQTDVELTISHPEQSQVDGTTSLQPEDLKTNIPDTH